MSSRKAAFAAVGLAGLAAGGIPHAGAVDSSKPEPETRETCVVRLDDKGMPHEACAAALDAALRAVGFVDVPDGITEADIRAHAADGLRGTSTESLSRTLSSGASVLTTSYWLGTGYDSQSNGGSSWQYWGGSCDPSLQLSLVGLSENNRFGSFQTGTCSAAKLWNSVDSNGSCTTGITTVPGPFTSQDLTGSQDNATSCIRFYA